MTLEGETTWEQLQDALGVAEDDPLTVTTKICPHDGAVLESGSNPGDTLYRCPVCNEGFLYYDDDNEEDEEEEG